MATVIGWILMLAPLLLPLLKKVFPKLVGKLSVFLGGLLGGAAVGGGKVGVLAKIVGAVGFVVSWLKRFPTWLKGLFAVGGILHWLRVVVVYLLCVVKTPILLCIMLVTSAFFPTFVEKLFLVVGSVVLRIFLWIFKLGKNVFLGAMDQAGSGGSNAIDEFRDTILGSFDELPPCMVEIMGYLHLVEDLGIIVTTATILALVSVFRIVYGGFITDKLR